MEGKKLFATGKRKTSIARIWMEKGKGNITVNNRTLDDYFGNRGTKKASVKQPLLIANVDNEYDIHVNVFGGGLTGHADAIRHGISKILIMIDPELRTILKKNHLLTRDPRKKERKKYGLKGARRKFQYSKR